jgi:hypothetical protein
VTKHNFPLGCDDPDTFLALEDVWALTEDIIVGVQYNDNVRLCHSIIEDILAVTMWEIEYNKKLKFNKMTLRRNVSNRAQRKRIMDMMLTTHISRHLDITAGKQLRIMKTREALREAMYYCGVHYELPISLV